MGELRRTLLNRSARSMNAVAKMKQDSGELSKPRLSCQGWNPWWGWVLSPHNDRDGTRRSWRFSENSERLLTTISENSERLFRFYPGENRVLKAPSRIQMPRFLRSFLLYSFSEKVFLSISTVQFFWKSIFVYFYCTVFLKKYFCTFLLYTFSKNEKTVQ